MGILQFIMLLFFILIYVGIVGGLLARFMKRGMGNYLKEREAKADVVPVRG